MPSRPLRPFLLSLELWIEIASADNSPGVRCVDNHLQERALCWPAYLLQTAHTVEAIKGSCGWLSNTRWATFVHEPRYQSPWGPSASRTCKLLVEERRIQSE